MTDKKLAKTVKAYIDAKKAMEEAKQAITAELFDRCLADFVAETYDDEGKELAAHLNDGYIRVQLDTKAAIAMMEEAGLTPPMREVSVDHVLTVKVRRIKK